MALEYGFYDSYNGDRVYSARSVNEIFEGVITDGVYAGIGDEFAVKPSSGLQATIGTGRAWFKSTWNKNPIVTPITFDKADPVYARIDTVCICAKQGIPDRDNDFYIYKGTIQTNPEPPIIVDEDNVFYLPLANVTIRPAADEIRSSDIEILVGKTRCPYVTSIIQQTDITKLFARWEDQFVQWWSRVRDILSDLESGNVSDILSSIEGKVDKSDKATEIDIAFNSDSAWMTPAMTTKMMAGLEARVSLLELMYGTDVSGNRFSITFDSLNNAKITGVWNDVLNRIEF